MTFYHFFAEAGRIARLSHTSADFVYSWNALEDRVHALADWQVRAMLDHCDRHAGEDWEAVCVLTSMVPDTYATPTMTDMLEA